MSNDFIHLELQQLRSSIREDLREELGRAFAWSQTGGSDAPLPAWSNAKVQSPPFVQPIPLMPCQADGVLRLTASDVYGPETMKWHGPDDGDKANKITGEAFQSHEALELKSVDGSEKSRQGAWASQAVPRLSKKVTFIGRSSEESGADKKPVGQDVYSGLEHSLMAAAARASQHKGGQIVSAGDSSLGLGKAKMLFSPHNIRQMLRHQTKPTLRSSKARKKDRDQVPLSFEEMFEMVAAIAILANGIFMGAQVEVMANKRTEEAPILFFFVEIVFCAIFSVELLLKLWTLRKSFFTGINRAWNMFDCFLVVLQILDLMMEAIGNLMKGANLQLSFLRMLRILRILRVMRLLRLLKFFGELNVVTSAIANSLKSLYGTVLMLLLMIYMFAIAFTGAANSHLIEMRDAGQSFDGTPLDVWWSSLGRSVLSLYESILGGVDWDDLMQGLLEMNGIWPLLFLVYISFMVLTMLNVITGIFVDSAVKHATRFHEKQFADNMRRLFNMSDTDHTGCLSRDEFNSQWTRPEFHFLMTQVGIEPREAKLLFDILLVGNNDDIDAEEFLAGMLRLRAGAKFIDIINLQHVIEQQSNQLDAIHRQTITNTFFKQ